MSRILLVDDEASIGWAVREALADEGHEVRVASSAEEGLRLASASPVDALLLDVRLPGMDGLTAMGAFRDQIGPSPIVVMTAFGSLETAVRAVEGGAFDYLVKPFDLDQVTTVVRRALERSSPADRKRPAEPATDDRTESPLLIGSSQPMQALFKQIALVAPSNVSVLITGESGTGKELVARALHQHGPRRNGPFVPVCLAALSPGVIEGELFGHARGSFTGATHDRKGLLELARGGTVLLDEVGDIPPALQVKLLRAIEQREVTPVGEARPRPIDVRFVAATNRPLGPLRASAQFRDDLYFRLGVFSIELPPLRDRLDDIPALAAHFLAQSRDLQPGGTTPTLTRAALDELRSRPWPGNVRELRNAIEHAAVVARGRASIHAEHLPPISTPATIASDSATDISAQIAAWVVAQQRSATGDLYERFLERVEPPLLDAVLKAHRGNRLAAAQALGIHRTTLRQKLRRYLIDPGDTV
jgi:two-component system nitrogen regulation response regulator GlnG